MHSKAALILLLCISFYFTIISAHILEHGHTCGHKQFNHEPGLVDVDEEFLPGQDRLLATGNSYPKIRMNVDYSNLVLGTTEFKNYVQNELMPVIIDYFQAALAIKQPLTTPLKIPSTTSLCGFKTPKALTAGVTTDFYVIVSSKSESSSNWVASAGSCFLSSTTKRPVVAQMLFNIYYTKPAKGDALLHEKNIYLTMHEMLHAFGFAGSSFKNFIDSNGKTLTGHIKSATLMGTKRTVLDVEPLTSKLRAHYGCPTLPGAFLEDDGGSGTEGSHFERKQFLYEAMTSGLIQGMKLSEFSFAVLEASGWYLPDYTYADPFFLGQGEGCNFVYQSCTSSAILNFEEFCSGSGRGCGAVGSGGGVCSTDTRSDNCRYYIPIIDYSCESASAVSNARFPKLESYGRSTGSKCFNGDLTTSSRSSNTTFCFNYNCIGTGLSTTIQILLGSTTVTCTKEGPLSVKGYSGSITCPDPLKFCNTVGKKICPRNCLGRGTCVDNQCQCNTGHTGIDCAMKA